MKMCVSILLRWATRMIVFIAVSVFFCPYSSQAATGNTDQWKVPAFKAKKKNPVSANEASLTLGKTLFIQECVACHGTTGRGDGPAAKDLEKSPGNLTDPQLWNQSDGSLFFKVTVGRRPMPSFRDTFKSEQRWHIINYIRTLTSPDVAPRFSIAESNRKAISALLNASYPIQGALAQDNLDQALAARETAAQAVGALAALPVEKLSKAAAPAWAASVAAFTKDAQTLNKADDLKTLRKAFASVSAHLNTALANFGHAEPQPVHLFHCPAAFKRIGAVWLQAGEETHNPYMGQDMIGCGKPVTKFRSVSVD